MINIQITDYPTIIAFWLVFIRFLTVMFQLPIFDNTAIPGTLKILMVLMCTYVFFPYLSPYVLQDIASIGVENFWILTVFNASIGLLIGYLVKSIMSIYIAAGSIITQQMGFGALRYFDATAGQQIGPFEKLLQWSILVLVISSGALLPMFKGMFSSFSSISLADWGGLQHSVPFFIRLFKTIFLSALMLSSPLIFTNVLIMVVLGIIARTVPQMNVLLVSFVINIGMGLLIFYTISSEFFHVAFKMYTEQLGEWFLLIT